MKYFLHLKSHILKIYRDIKLHTFLTSAFDKYFQFHPPVASAMHNAFLVPSESQWTPEQV
jgi:hypothetical protein